MLDESLLSLLLIIIMSAPRQRRYSLTLRLLYLPQLRILDIRLKHLLRLLEYFLFTQRIVVQLDSTGLHLIEGVLGLLLVFVGYLLGELGGHLELCAGSTVSTDDVVGVLGLVLVETVRVALICGLTITGILVVVDYISLGILWFLLVTLLHHGHLLTELAANKLHGLVSALPAPGGVL